MSGGLIQWLCADSGWAPADLEVWLGTELVQPPAPWTPTDADRSAAWLIWLELESRITTQALAYREGDERAALDSVYQLFPRTREVLREQGPGASTVGPLALHVLNRKVRWFTARWHKRLLDGRLGSGDDIRTFRAELELVRRDLQVYAAMLQKIATGTAPALVLPTPLDPGDVPEPETLPLALGLSLEGPIPVDTLHDTWARELHFEDAERAGRKARRDAWFGSHVPRPSDDDLVGLCISGGGIRSATFATGVLQALSERGLFKWFDVVSTVSGGGYVGSLMSAWTSKLPEDVGEVEEGRAEQVARGPFWRQEGELEPLAVRHLRNRSRYLLQYGPLEAVMPVLTGIVTSLALVIAVAVPLACGAALLGMALHRVDAATRWLTVLGVCGLVVILTLLGQRGGTRARRAFVDRWGVYILGGVVGVVGLVELLYAGIHAWLRGGLGSPVSWAVGLGLFVLLVTGLRAWGGVARALLAASPILGFLGVVAAVMAMLEVVYLDLVRRAARASGVDPLEVGLLPLLPRFLEQPMVWGIGLAFALALVVLLLADINIHAPRRFYRDRLARTYCVRLPATWDGDTPTHLEEASVDLSALSEVAPLHLLNFSVNITAPKNDGVGLGLRGRGGDFYTVSRLGEESPSFQPRERAPDDMSLPDAMAISGAAVSPLMGVLGVSGAAWWLTLFNLRMGYWMPNPGLRDGSVKASVQQGASVRYLAKELRGAVDETSSLIHVSDGGHIENLGLIELLRRKCTAIVVIDGECDPTMSCGALVRATRYARLMLGAEIRIDRLDLRLDAEGLSRDHVAVGQVRYHDGSTGTLLYIKSSVTGNEPADVLGYRAHNPTFPHETTADQVFDEAQFEAYRALGQHVGDELFAGWEGDTEVNLVTWLEALWARRRDPHEVAAPPA